MPRFIKRVMFRDKLRTVAEIARLLGVPESTIYTRLYNGRELDAPKGEARRIDSPVDEPAAQEPLVRGECLSSREVAKRIGVSYQRVQQIEERAFAKIRRQARFSKDARALLELIEEMRNARGGQHLEEFNPRYRKKEINIRRSA